MILASVPLQGLYFAMMEHGALPIPSTASRSVVSMFFTVSSGEQFTSFAKADDFFGVFREASFLLLFFVHIVKAKYVYNFIILTYFICLHSTKSTWSAVDTNRLGSTSSYNDILDPYKFNWISAMDPVYPYKIKYLVID